MSRTREIEVKIPITRNELDRFIEGDINGVSVYNQLYGKDLEVMIKAKLIIELPERKVTISEREFYEKTCDFFRTLSGPNSDIQIAKKWQEMFFKDTE